MERFDPIKILLLGLISIGYGSWSYFSKRSRLNTWIPAKGVVENVRRNQDQEVAVVVKFLGRDGNKHTSTISVADSDVIGLGTEIQIAYNPELPSQAFVADKKDMNTAIVISLVSGIALLFAATLLFLAGRVWDKR